MILTVQAGSPHYVSMEHIHRRSLPHWYVEGTAHFVTFRLANTIPTAVHQTLRELKHQLLHPVARKLLPQDRMRIHKKLFVKYDRYLDDNRRIDWLQHPTVAKMVRDNLYHHDGTKYHLHAYCVMPNHMHVLFTASPEFCNDCQHIDRDLGESSDGSNPLSKIMHSLKSYTANQANSILNRTGKFWQGESYDHWIRDDDELERVVNYIRANPVRAKLVSTPEQWKWSSCYDRYQLDGDCSGWLPQS